MSEAEVVTDGPKKRGRKPGSTTKSAEPKAPKTVEDLQAAQSKTEEKLAKLQAELAIRKFPGLENSVTSLLNFTRNVKKADAAIKAGADVNVEEQKKAYAKQVEFHEAKIKQLKEQIANSNGETIVKQLGEAYEASLNDLANAYKTLSVDFTNAGTTVEAVVPDISMFKSEIEKRNANPA